ncbi:MAG: hypothetical protein Q7R52_02875 [archaeon]|nr:hypothetical protein [archaeon]
MDYEMSRTCEECKTTFYFNKKDILSIIKSKKRILVRCLDGCHAGEQREIYWFRHEKSFFKKVKHKTEYRTINEKYKVDYINCFACFHEIILKRYEKEEDEELKIEIEKEEVGGWNGFW